LTVTDPALGRVFFIAESLMKSIMIGLCGVGLCAAVAAGLWLATEPPADIAAAAAPAAASGNSPRTTSADQPSGMWSWGMSGAAKTDAGKPELDGLLAQAQRATSSSGESGDARNQLRKLAKEDPAVMAQLMQSYGKQANPQTRQLIVSLLSNVEKPEVLAFSKRLAASSDITQRKDGLLMLQNLSSDTSDVRAVVLQTLARDKSPEVVRMALAALRPPPEGNTAPPDAKEAAAVVAQLQELTTNADPVIRQQSLLQLAQWDKTGSSQTQWTQALADQSPEVRQAAVTAIAQSGTQSDTVKAALIGLANNQSERRDVRNSALQVLGRFNLSKDEAANYNQLKAQILGS
jgi:hypothetical protein